MLDRGDKIIVGVSGGPDSMCLLHILMNLKDEFSLNLIAAHVNHGLRGIDADEDEKYVREFCYKNNIKFTSIKADVHKLSIERNLSCESAGRDLRYEFFEKLKKELCASKVALAHNLNDQAETVLMRVIRGTALNGLSGIKPVREGVFIRPLLYSNRREIEEYCLKNNLNPRIDKTNFETIYARNKIRLELIPYIEKNFNKDIINTLSRLAESSRIDSNYIDQNSENKFKIYCTLEGDKVIISKEGFLDHEAIITRVIRKAFIYLLEHLNNFDKLHISQIIDLQKGSTGKLIMLPNDLIAQNNYGDIHIIKKTQENQKVTHDLNEYKLNFGENHIKNLGLKITIEQISSSNKNYEDLENVKYFDMDKITGDLMLRFRKEGDRFNPLGMVGSKKLKDIFIDLKIPREQRDKIPLICFGDKIAWITGHKISNSFKIDISTKNIIRMKLESEGKR